MAYKDPEDALKAARALEACGGGVVAISDGKADVLELPVAGLMSTDPCAEIAANIDRVQASIDRISGGKLHILATAVMSLPVVPGPVITDLGLVDGLTQEFIPVFL